MNRLPLILIAICSAVGVHGVASDNAMPPNIVIIIADDLGYGELGCYGGTQIPTPNIDALAANGIRYTNGYVTASYCAASRAGLMTGRYQTEFGFESNPIGAANERPGIGLPVDETTLADDLRLAGYVTALVGKWHLGGAAEFHPQRRGFDEFYGFLHEGHFFVPKKQADATTWLRRKRLPDGSMGRWASSDGRLIYSTVMNHFEPPYDTNNPIVRSSQPVDEKRHLTDAFTREAIDFIDRHRQQPFGLVLAYNAVHSPLQAVDKYMSRFSHIDDVQRRIFAAMLSHLDDGIGEVMETLDRHRLRRRTIVIFVSDNGGPTLELTSRNAPLRGGKGQVYEGGIRVPMIVSWPDTVAPRREDKVVIATDIRPMVLAASKSEVSAVQSELLRPASSSDSPRTLYWRMKQRRAIRMGDHKLVKHRDQWELYDLANDIAETTDLSKQNPELAKQLQDRWQRWSDQQSPPRW